MNLQERFTSFSMVGAAWVLWLLVGLSVIGLAIIIERCIQLLSSRDDLDELEEQLKDLLARGEVDTAKGRLGSSKSVEARVVAAGLQAWHQGPASVEERMAAESQLARIQMERNLAFLGTVGNNAPFVGLLGTVIGIIGAFKKLDESAGQVTAGLMAQIGEALVATAIGILVALPAVAFYNFFMRTIRNRLSRADALGRHVLAMLKAGT